ncbi:hypothetical protein NP233_g6124 [Leucocoprinus birnbaumii]|uniref:Uncharacterized protein n=1 Tax=Leucocoprinus birnbaumii TaxID=56174 RepID=A0AAD5VTW4_9AGAR|nr:hypothetical protein NP233_g6124 [Leucocoprinus birnbaumii]
MSTASPPKINEITLTKEPGLRPRQPGRTRRDNLIDGIQEENVLNPQDDDNPYQRGHQVPVVGMLPDDRSQSLWMKTSPHRLERIPGVKLLDPTSSSNSLLSRLSEEMSQPSEHCDKDPITSREASPMSWNKIDSPSPSPPPLIARLTNPRVNLRERMSLLPTDEVLQGRKTLTSQATCPSDERVSELSLRLSPMECEVAGKSEKMFFRGIEEGMKLATGSPRVCERPKTSLNIITETSKQSNVGLVPLRELPNISLLPSGPTSSKGSPLTWKMCSDVSSQSENPRKRQETLEELSSLSPNPNPANPRSKRSRLHNSGKAPGGSLLKRLASPSLTVETNSTNIQATSSTNSLVDNSVSMTRSSDSTQRSETRSEGERTVPWSTEKSSSPSGSLSCYPEGSNTGDPRPAIAQQKEGMIPSAITSTPRGAATTKTVDMTTSAETAEAPLTVKQSARNLEHWMRVPRPRYLRYNKWNAEGLPVPGVVEWSKHAKPFPKAPTLPDDHPAMQTIHNNPDLFKVTTPIDVPKLRRYLSSHPNRPFIDSICDGLEHGFWPWADADPPNYPLTNDAKQRPTPDLAKATFLRQQRDKEVGKGRFSKGFEGPLHPGMYCMPIFAVPKNRPGKYRLVTHQSFGPYSLNSMTPPHERAFPLDSIVRLGDQLLRKHKANPKKGIILWKSDISEAYRMIPVHPLWQIKQVNTIDDVRYIDHCNAFGGRRSGDIFIGVNSSILWAAEHVGGVEDPSAYIDDHPGLNYEGEVELYSGYQVPKWLPRGQARLLSFWDDLGVPHEEEKQEHGPRLDYLGLHIDTVDLTITMPAHRKADFLRELDRFIPTAEKPHKRFLARDWSVLAGWATWSFNVFPMLRPMVSNVYQKLNETRSSERRIRVTKEVAMDLKWGRQYVEESDGIHILKEHDWTFDDADMVVYTDASNFGMGFWVKSLHLGFWSRVSDDLPSEWIYYREALTLVSAVSYATSVLAHDSRIVMFTDNTNVQAMFNSLGVKPLYNTMVKNAVDNLIATKCQLWVMYVPGEDNQVADALSRGDQARALHYDPQLEIFGFEPPREALGAAQK